MADLHKFTVQEALNTTAAPGFTIADASSGGIGGSSGAAIAAAASGGSTKNFDIANNTNMLLLYVAEDIYFSFTTSDTNIDEDIDPILPAGALTSIAVPRGIGARTDTIRFNFLSTSTATPTVRIVEV